MSDFLLFHSAAKERNNFIHTHTHTYIITIFTLYNWIPKCTRDCELTLQRLHNNITSLNKVRNFLCFYLNTNNTSKVQYSYFRKVNISIPKKTQNNGTLFLHIFLVPQGVLSPFSSPWKQHQHSSLTTYIIPQAETFNLMGSENKLNNTQVSHNITVFSLLLLSRF